MFYLWLELVLCFVVSLVWAAVAFGALVFAAYGVTMLVAYGATGRLWSVLS